MIYDYLIVGSGLYGATCAYELKKRVKGFSRRKKKSYWWECIY